MGISHCLEKHTQISQVREAFVGTWAVRTFRVPSQPPIRPHRGHSRVEKSVPIRGEKRTFDWINYLDRQLIWQMMIRCWFIFFKSYDWFLTNCFLISIEFLNDPNVHEICSFWGRLETNYASALTQTTSYLQVVSTSIFFPSVLRRMQN